MTPDRQQRLAEIRIFLEGRRTDDDGHFLEACDHIDWLLAEVERLEKEVKEFREYKEGAKAFLEPLEREWKDDPFRDIPVDKKVFTG